MKSESVKSIAKALSEFGKKCPEIQKKRTARVFSKRTNKEFTYSYADLSDVLRAVSGPLSETGLAVVQTMMPIEEGTILETSVIHESGEWVSSHYLMNTGGLSPQEMGSQITYARRYSICSILNIAADEDDDGELAQGRNKQLDSRNGNHPQREGAVNKVNQTDNRGVPGPTSQGSQNPQPKNERPGTQQQSSTVQKNPDPISNNAAKNIDPDSPVRPSHLRDLSDAGRRQGWANEEITELTRKMLKKESVRELNLGELNLLRQAMTSMTVEQMKQTAF